MNRLILRMNCVAGRLNRFGHKKSPQLLCCGLVTIFTVTNKTRCDHVNCLRKAGYSLYVLAWALLVKVLAELASLFNSASEVYMIPYPPLLLIRLFFTVTFAPRP